MGFSENLSTERIAGIVWGVAVAVSGGYVGMELGNRIEKFQSLPNASTSEIVHQTRAAKESLLTGAVVFTAMALLLVPRKSLDQMIEDRRQGIYPLSFLINNEQNFRSGDSDAIKKARDAANDVIEKRKKSLTAQAIGFFAVAGVALVPAALINLSAPSHVSKTYTVALASPFAEKVVGVLKSPVFGNAADAGLGVSCFMGVLGASALAGKRSLNEYKEIIGGFASVKMQRGL
jgi:hypothetical protein